MGSTGLVYATKTGHSRKIAQAIGKELGIGVLDVLAEPSEPQDELLFIVGGIYAGKSMPQLLEYARRLSAGHVKKAVLVTSAVSEQGCAQTELRGILEEKGIEVLEEIKCPGSFLFFKMGRPSSEDLHSVAMRAAGIARSGGYK